MHNEHSAMVEDMQCWHSSLFISQYPLLAQEKAAWRQYIDDCCDAQTEDIASLVAVAAKRGLKESDFDFLNHAPGSFDNLKSFFVEAVEMAAWQCNADCWTADAQLAVDVVESWYHVSHFGAVHDAHTHPNCSWCGIFCIDSGEAGEQKGGANRFYDPRTNAAAYMDAGNAYLDAEGFWDIYPKSGQLIIFPAFLRHSALAYFSDVARVVLAFNCQVHLR